MNDQQLLRYSRQIMLPYFGVEAQQRLLNARALIIGLGGLGSPAAMYLAAAGVGHLVLNDFDEVDLSNLQRQIAHSTDRIGQKKVASAAQTLTALNPDTQLTLLDEKLDDQALAEQVAVADIVLDCSDNFDIRFLLNRLCVAHKTPLVSGAAIRMEGQVSVFNQTDESACYRCLYQDDLGDEALTCSDNGVLAPVVGIIGSMQALEAIKALTHVGQTLDNRLLILDAFTLEWRQMKLKADPNCPVCGNNENGSSC